MLYSFVGPIDSPAAAVLVVLFASIAAIAMVAMALQQVRRNKDAEHELDRVRQHDQQQYNLKQLESKNTITSHRAD